MHGSTTGLFCRATVVDVAGSPAPTIGQARTIRAPLSARGLGASTYIMLTNRSSSSGPTCSRMCGRASRGHRARCRPGEPHGPVRAARHVVSGRKPCRVTAAWCICTRRKPDQASACRCQAHVLLRGPVPEQGCKPNWVTACRHARTGLCRRLYHRKPSWAAA